MQNQMLPSKRTGESLAISQDESMSSSCPKLKTVYDAIRENLIIESDSGDDNTLDETNAVAVSHFTFQSPEDNRDADPDYIPTPSSECASE